MLIVTLSFELYSYFLESVASGAVSLNGNGDSAHPFDYLESSVGFFFVGFRWASSSLSSDQSRPRVTRSR